MDVFFAVIGLIVSAVSAVAGAVSAMDAADAQKQALDYNADVMDAQAQSEREAAAFAETQQREQAAKLRARQRVAYASSGIDLSEGTPLEVLGQQAGEMEMDALTIRYNGEIKAKQSESQAAIYRMQGAQAQRAGFANAGSSLLTGLGGAATTAMNAYTPKAVPKTS
jgi:hypothetical protein